MPVENTNYTSVNVSVSSFDTSLETLHIGIDYTELTRGDNAEQFYQDYYLPKVGTSLIGEPATYGAPPVDINSFDFSEYPISVSGYNLDPYLGQQSEITFYFSKEFEQQHNIIKKYVYQNIGQQEVVHKLDPKYYDTGMPAASAENEGQALVSTKKYTKGATVVPEQTVTTVGDEAELDGLVPSLVSDNQSYIVVVDGNEYTGVAYRDEANHEYILELNDDNNNYEVIFSYTDGGTFGAWFLGNVYTEYTVAIYVAEPFYSWEPDPYAGYDIVIQVNHDDIQHITAQDSVVRKGSYEKAAELAINNKPIRCLVYYVYHYTDDLNSATYRSFPITYVYCDPGYNNTVVIYILPYAPYAVAMNTAGTGNVFIYGAANIFGEFNLTESGLEYQCHT